METIDGMIPAGAKPRDKRGLHWYRVALLLFMVATAAGVGWLVMTSDARYVNESDAEEVIHKVGDKRYLTLAASQQQMIDLKAGQSSNASQFDSKLNSMQTDIREIRNILLQQAYNRRGETP